MTTQTTGIPSQTSGTHDDLLANLAARSRDIADMLQLNRDEAGYLDKKLRPELIAAVAKAVDALGAPATRSNAERFLAVELLEEATPTELLIAILRQSFRVKEEFQRRWLTDHLSHLVEIDETGVGRQVLLEAAGSDIPALSRLVDDVSLAVALHDDLVRLALDPYCSPSVRVRAAGKLLHHQDVQGVDAALDLLDTFHTNPDLRKELRELILDTKALQKLEADTLQEFVVEPVMYMFSKTTKEQPERANLLKLIVEQLPAAFLRHFQALDPVTLDDNNWFNVIVSLERCAFYEVGATELLMDWALIESVPDRIRAECCVRIAHERTQRPRDFADRLEQLQQSVAYSFHSNRQQEKAEEGLQRAAAGGRTRRAAEITFKELFEQWRDTGDLDRDLAWELWMARDARPVLGQKIRRGDPSTLEFVGDLLVSSVIDKVGPDRRCELLMEYLGKVNPKRPDELYDALYRAADRLESAEGGLRQRAINFFVERSRAGGRDMEIARQYWSKLARIR